VVCEKQVRIPISMIRALGATPLKTGLEWARMNAVYLGESLTPVSGPNLTKPRAPHALLLVVVRRDQFARSSIISTGGSTRLVGNFESHGSVIFMTMTQVFFTTLTQAPETFGYVLA